MKKLLLFTFLIFPFLSQAQVSLVKDINPGSANGVATYSNNRISFNNKLIFAGGDITNGIEIWITDGSLISTSIIKDLWTGVASGNPKNFAIWQNELIFMADEGGNQSSRKNLFRSDMTELGTVNMANNLNFYSSPYFFNNNLYIGRENVYWAQNLGDVMAYAQFAFSLPNTIESDFTLFLGELNNKILFRHPSSFLVGNELWISDGTSSGTSLLKDINPGNGASNVDNFVVFNSKAYFTANDGTNGRELWVTDGTVSGTQMVLDIYSGSTGSNPQNLTVFNNALYFTADHPTLGTEIFKMTTTENITNLKNIASGSGNSNPSNLFVYNGALYFSADDGINGIELWSSTGFPSTTNLLKNINSSPSSPDSNPSGFAEYFGELYFAANDGVNGRELWKTDGTNAGTVLVSNINPSGDSSPSDLIVANNILFFSANDGTTGIELWKYQDASLSTNDFELQNSISLFPNPTATNFTIESKFQLYQISIIDLQGKTVKSFSKNLEVYNIEDLTSGIYLINIKTEQGKTTKKLIKE